MITRILQNVAFVIVAFLLLGIILIVTGNMTIEAFALAFFILAGMAIAQPLFNIGSSPSVERLQQQFEIERVQQLIEVQRYEHDAWFADRRRTLELESDKGYEYFVLSVERGESPSKRAWIGRIVPATGKKVNQDTWSMWTQYALEEGILERVGDGMGYRLAPSPTLE